MQNKFDVRQLTLAAIIAAAYASLTLALPALSYGVVQIRFSEALTVLPFLFPAATPGVILGCFIANILSPYGLIDVVIGTLATGLAAYLTGRMSRNWLAPLPPVLCNALLIGAMIAWYEVGFTALFAGTFTFNALTVGVGQLVACYGLGMPLLVALPKIDYLRGRMNPARLR